MLLSPKASSPILCHVLSLHPPLLLLFLSDYIIKEKTVLLQKKDNEGFGFVLRGAKGEPLHPHGPRIILPL